ncbi:TetR/AcrR family transcriptional regulator [Ammoniphilus resinae]|uniref:AcrR family transcriptional regulator n=1 Tax=Ammoniphilus resinae TaxID=861532 RepID=A0ABS4GK23_9BACL|nr:TetR/AcrR family transcriptional regulator [Ammoniphilus resinae]MBP1930613.1 AcrR family transcriptional regulator [Ammoniphilus resinae]
MGKPKNIKKQDLISSARKQLLQKGQTQVTLKNVAQAAGVTQGVVYYHFKTKDQLLLSLLEDYLEKLKVEEKRTLKSWLADEMYKAQISSGEMALLFELISLSLHQKEMKNTLGQALRQKIRNTEEWAGADPTSARLITAMLDGLAMQAIFDPTFDEREVYDAAKKKLLDLLGNDE